MHGIIFETSKLFFPITETFSALDLRRDKIQMIFIYPEEWNSVHFELEAVMTLAKLLDAGLQLPGDI